MTALVGPGGARSRTLPGARVAAVCASVLMLATVAAACTGSAASRSAARRASGADPVPTATARVSVDAAASLGALNNLADYQNQADHSLSLGPRDVELARALRPTVMRAWLTPRRYYHAATGQFTFDYTSASGNTVYNYLDQVAGQAQRLMLNLEQCPQELMTMETPWRCRDVLKAGIRHYKQRYPQLVYIELFNEPDKNWPLQPGDSRPMPVDEYYRWYQIGYEVVNELNREALPGKPLRIGGPVTYTFDQPYLERFLTLFSQDPNPTKRLDFISYHQYRARANPASVATEKASVVEWLDSRGLDRQTPVYVTEYGVFPGENTGTSFDADQLTQAAAMSTLGYYYTESGMDMVMHWVYDHPTNDRKSMFVDNVDGAVTPYYNMVAMQRMLSQTRLSAHSDALSVEGIGVNALATGARNRVAVLVTNYQWTNGTASYLVNLTVDPLPAGFTGRDVLVQRYLVDARTSNYDSDREHDTLQRVQRATVDAAGSVEVTFPLEPNAICLVVLTPTG